MASRCISTLNDLDKISKRIYHKHSKVSDESWTLTLSSRNVEKLNNSLTFIE